jgi:hypothetical protein
MKPQTTTPGPDRTAERGHGSELREALLAVSLQALPQLVKALLDRVTRPGAGPIINGTKLTMEDAFRFFQENKAHSALAASGAIVRVPDRSGVRVFLMFLDRDQNPLVTGPLAAPVGNFLVRDLDPELAMAFGSQNVIVID